MSRRMLAWLGLGVLVVGVLAVALWPRGSESTAARAHRLETQIKCVDCESLSVADSETDTARAARADILDRVRHGESDATIRQAYVDRFGQSVLLQPATNGIGLVVWALPVGLLIVGAGGIVLALRRWQRQPRMKATEADQELVERTRAELAEDKST
jgi:cytochrome c-type biogenesis protein CcmH